MLVACAGAWLISAGCANFMEDVMHPGRRHARERAALMREHERDVAAREKKYAEMTRQQYVAEHEDMLTEPVKEAILSGRVRLGMIADEVRASVGKPNRINRSVGSWGVHEQWVYDGGNIYLENGVVASFQDRG
ncbi:MAG: hypothetical protein AAF581_19500 [Planctomycetota bacterium]